jgi:anti-sigma regulatory factor (Ser/Thr protein kinase)
VDLAAPETAVGRSPGTQPLVASAAYEGDSESIGAARRFTRDFLTRVPAEGGPVVSPSVSGAAQLVVGELVTNVCKYAPGPCLLDLEVADGLLTVAVWDTHPELPAILATDPGRIGQHGLEIVMALAQSLDLKREPVGKRIRVQLALNA